MSVADDIELRDLVSQILEKNGTLAKIRAELRASVFLALEDQSVESKLPFVNSALKEYLTRDESALGLCIVREFLEYLHLDNTLAVFNTETCHGKDYEYKGRSNLLKDLHLEKFKDKKGPLLSTILHIAQESLGSSNISAHRNEEQQPGESEASNLSPKTNMPTNISYTETSNASLDHPHNLLNQTFTTEALITSFGSPESGYQTFPPKSLATNEKKFHSGSSNGDANPKDVDVLSDSKKDCESSDSKNLSSKEKPVHITSTNPQTSLSNLPPLSELKTNKIHGSVQKSFLSALGDDHYEEDFSSESSGAGDKDLKGKSGRSHEKKEAKFGPDRTSTKDVNSPVASVSEELEGDTNSVTDDGNSAASGDTLDSSLSYLETKYADHIEKV